MAQNVYENLVILDSNKYAQNPADVGAQIPNLVAKFGGEVLVSRLWNEQKLAYPIDGHKKGTYWLTYFRLDSLKLIEFSREIRINEIIVREMTLKVDPRLVDALVEHAKGGGKSRAAEVVIPAVDEPEIPDVIDDGLELGN
ncbi:MAG: 30S ribosomal protein S6 [Planctomycetales bacterium]|nr:30S ribosomal protein S6 [Planctomycetales bacterium]